MLSWYWRLGKHNKQITLKENRIHFCVGGMTDKANKYIICFDVMMSAGKKIKQEKGLSVILCPMVREGSIIS